MKHLIQLFICTHCYNHGLSVLVTKKIEEPMAILAYCGTCKTQQIFKTNCVDICGRKISLQEVHNPHVTLEEALDPKWSGFACQNDMCTNWCLKPLTTSQVDRSERK